MIALSHCDPSSAYTLPKADVEPDKGIRIEEAQDLWFRALALRLRLEVACSLFLAP